VTVSLAIAAIATWAAVWSAFRSVQSTEPGATV
jgi:hypothetical protein